MHSHCSLLLLTSFFFSILIYLHPNDLYFYFFFFFHLSVFSPLFLLIHISLPYFILLIYLSAISPFFFLLFLIFSSSSLPGRFSWLSRAIETAWLVLDELDLLWLPIIKTWRLNERLLTLFLCYV